jgi:hypothetical protein
MLTWRQLARDIHAMTDRQQFMPVRFVLRLGEEDQDVILLGLIRAEQDIYQGIGIGNRLQVEEKDWYLEDSGDRL